MKIGNLQAPLDLGLVDRLVNRLGLHLGHLILHLGEIVGQRSVGFTGRAGGFGLDNLLLLGRLGLLSNAVALGNTVLLGGALALARLWGAIGRVFGSLVALGRRFNDTGSLLQGADVQANGIDGNT